MLKLDFSAWTNKEHSHYNDTLKSQNTLVEASFWNYLQGYITCETQPWHFRPEFCAQQENPLKLKRFGINKFRKGGVLVHPLGNSQDIFAYQKLSIDSLF